MPSRCLLDRRRLLSADAPRIRTKPKFEILTDYQSADIARYESFLGKNQIQVAGIESVQDTLGNTYTYDVNTNTNYNSDAEAAAGCSMLNWPVTSGDS